METLRHIPTPVFNGSVETGLRSLILLEAFYPEKLDLDALALLDYFVVHTADLGGPDSLHPALPERVGEYRVRRTLIQEALHMLLRVSLIEVVEAVDGISFVSGDDAPAFVKLLNSDYNRDLSDRASWLAGRVHDDGAAAFASMRDLIDRWSLEFQTEVGLPNG
ncbi:ABC-three component system middle component 2 [Mesorhizobium sp. M0586]|uniref:ABC-three component system middle component 2 n=1 Tax=unclassified Mesorhizobium TaxID=325217 RepID=UPI00333C92A2